MLFFLIYTNPVERKPHLLSLNCFFYCTHRFESQISSHQQKQNFYINRAPSYSTGMLRVVADLMMFLNSSWSFQTNSRKEILKIWRQRNPQFQMKQANILSHTSPFFLLLSLSSSSPALEYLQVIIPYICYSLNTHTNFTKI